MSLKLRAGRIVEGGMGAFLCPPGHPEHSWHVETNLRRKPENRGTCTLGVAADSDWLDRTLTRQARELLAAWAASKPPVSAHAIHEWVLQVLGYFRACYKSTNPLHGELEAWNASNLRIDASLDPMEHREFHAGVRHVRRYYADFVPTADDFAQSYWGEKPVTIATITVAMTDEEVFGLIGYPEASR